MNVNMIYRELTVEEAKNYLRSRLRDSEGNNKFINSVSLGAIITHSNNYILVIADKDYSSLELIEEC